MPQRFAALLWLALTTSAAAAPQAELWERWQANDPESEASIDHGAWTAFLEQHIQHDPELGLNRLRYSAVGQADREALDAYIDRLEGIEIAKYHPDEQFAFWLNLYNAVTVDLVLDAYPVDSIRDIGGGLFSRGPWDEKVTTVDGVQLSLNDIEHRILRPIWDDPLVHYGVNCASVSCPNLRAQAYTGDEVYTQLRENARAYVNSPHGVRIEGPRVIGSRVYQWYREDFGGSEAGVLSHLRRYAEPALSARLDAAVGIDAYVYDWKLNDAAEP